MSELLLKVCGMRNAENIRQVDQLKPDFMGFIFYPDSPRNIPDTIILPETKAEKVGVFVNDMVSTIIAKASKHQIKTLQLHGSESVETCNLLSDLGYDVIKAFRIDKKTTLEEIAPYKGSCKLFLFDTKAEKVGGTGKKFDWNLLSLFDHLGEYFLSGGIRPEDLCEIKNLKLKNLIGIDINSGFEIEPALKNTTLINTFSNELKQP